MTTTLITSLDIGSTYTKVIIAEIDEKDDISIVSTAVTPTDGLDNGIIQDISKVASSIKRTVRIAEEKESINIANVYVSFYSDQFKCMNKSEKQNMADTKEPVIINQSHINMLLDNVRNAIAKDPANSNYVIQHLIPQYYVLDDKRVLNPLNMTGSFLEVFVHVILADKSEMNNLQACLQEAEIKYKEIVAKPIASTLAVVSPDEMKMGCIMMDIGGGTTDVALIKDNFFYYNKLELVGGNNLTFNIAKLLKTTPRNAENIKKESGSAVSDLVDSEEFILVEGIGGRAGSKFTLKFLHEIIESKLQLLFENIYNNTIKNNNNSNRDFTAGIVITGGTSKLKHIDELIFRIFNLPVRIGLPLKNNIHVDDQKILNEPLYATALGLLRYARNQYLNNKRGFNMFSGINLKKIGKSGTYLKSFISKIMGGE